MSLTEFYNLKTQIRLSYLVEVLKLCLLIVNMSLKKNLVFDDLSSKIDSTKPEEPKEITLLDLNSKSSKKISFEEAIDFILQEKDEETPYILVLLGLDDSSIEQMRKNCKLNPVLDSECSNSWTNNKDSVLVFDEYFLLTINDANNLDQLESPVSLKMLVFKTMIIILGKEELYSIDQVFKKDFNFSPISPDKLREPVSDTQKNWSPKIRIEITEDCSQIESFFFKIIESIYSRLESIIIDITEKTNQCMNASTEFGLSNRVEFSVSLSLAKRNLIYLEEIMTSKSQLFKDLLDSSLFSDSFKYYLGLIDVRTSVLMQQIRNNNVLIKIAERIYAECIESTLVSSSKRLNDITKIFSSVATLFLPLNLVAGLFGMNVEVPYQFYIGYEPFISILVLSFGTFCIFIIILKLKGWM